MGLGFTGFIRGICMWESGLEGRVTVLELRLALMGAVMLGSSSVVSSMALVVTILGEFFY